MGYIYVAEYVNDEIHIKNEITQEELDLLNSAFSVCGPYNYFTELKDIVLLNGSEFQRFMKPETLQKLHGNHMSYKQMITTANKIVLNYATSLKIYVDTEERYLRENKGEKTAKGFHQLCSQFYDKNIEYRFWMNFRNYVMHYDLPYCSFKEEIGSTCRVVCPKDHLLKFSNWKHTKADIEKMPDEIDLPAMVENMSSMIYALYMNFFTYFAPEIELGLRIYGKFCRDHNVKSPIIAKTDARENLSGLNLQPLPVAELNAAFKVLQSNPNCVVI